MLYKPPTLPHDFVTTCFFVVVWIVLQQVMSGDIPDIVAEGEEDAGRSPVIGMDLPKRRTSTNGGLPSPASVPAKWGSYQRWVVGRKENRCDSSAS